MTTTSTLISHFQLTLDGADATDALNAAIASIEVDCSLYMPDMFVIRLNDPQLEWIDYTGFAIGTAVTITAVNAASESSELIEGEITALEPEYTKEGFGYAVVRGYDKAHRLQRVRATQTFTQMTDSDIVSSVASGAGLSATCDSTSTSHDYVLQDNETNYDFLRRLALRNGFVLKVSGRTLTFGKPEGATEAATDLNFGENILEFRPRLTAAAQADSATISGWDVQAKAAITGQSSSPSPMNAIGTDGHSAASTFGATGALSVVDMGAKDQTELTNAATALLNMARSGDVNAEGLCTGIPTLRPGYKVNITNLGTRFSGTYMLTRTVQRIDSVNGYTTHIEVSNGSGETAAGLMATVPGFDAPSLTDRTIVVAIVTNNNDTEGSLGRVKVKFPWMPQHNGTEVESAWARLAAPMAGNSMGIMFYPEVNDEVLVAFDHGDPTRPYIVGALWNGSDATPIAQSTAVVSGKVEQRVIKTRAGHTILLDDSDGKSGIQILDAQSKNTIIIDSVGGKITIVADQEVDIKTTTPTTEISMTGGKITVKGTNISIEADAQLELKSSGTIKMSGPTIQIDGSAMTEIKGGVIKLN